LDSDWEAFLREMKALRPRFPEMRAMVFSDGGGPTAEQRKRLAVVMGGQDIKTTVISDKGVVRFVVATIGLFNKLIRTYSWQDVADAYAWLGLTGAEEEIIESAVRDMDAVIESRRPRSPARGQQYRDRSADETDDPEFRTGA
jgi:hypothetical protein